MAFWAKFCPLMADVSWHFVRSMSRDIWPNFAWNPAAVAVALQSLGPIIGFLSLSLSLSLSLFIVTSTSNHTLRCRSLVDYKLIIDGYCELWTNEHIVCPSNNIVHCKYIIVLNHWNIIYHKVKPWHKLPIMRCLLCSTEINHIIFLKNNNCYRHGLRKWFCSEFGTSLGISILLACNAQMINTW